MKLSAMQKFEDYFHSLPETRQRAHLVKLAIKVLTYLEQ